MKRVRAEYYCKICHNKNKEDFAPGVRRICIKCQQSKRYLEKYEK
jgi:hypothetical protein